MKRSLVLLFFGLLTVVLFGQILPSGSASSRKATTRNRHTLTAQKHRKAARTRMKASATKLQSATASSHLSQAVSAAVPQYTIQGTLDLAPSSPQLTAVDPYANPANPNDTLKPARPFWYSVDKDGLTVLTLGTNQVVERIPWNYIPAGTTTPGFPVVQPDGEFVNVVPPAEGYQVVGMTVSYPTEEALASNSETPPTYVYVVVANSGYEWQSNPSPDPLAGRDPNLRDTLAPKTSSATESAMLIQVDVTDPTLPLNDAAAPVAPLAGAILGHGAGQPAYDPGTGNVYVGNMPSTSLPAGLQSFVSVVASIAVPEVAAAGEAGGIEAPPIILPLESPDVLPNTPLAWPLLAEGGEGPFLWEFQNLPTWLTAHIDKITGQMDGIVYGTVPASGSWTFQVRVTDMAEPTAPNPSEWTNITMTANAAAEEQLAGELPFEAGVPNAVALQGTGSCTPGPTSSLGSIVPAWIDVVTVPGGVNPSKPTEQTIGCVVMGTAPISGEYYQFTMPNFMFAYPWDREPVLFDGNVAGAYVFDPLPAGVTLSGLAWHQIEKIHDPSTEADILNAEFIGVEPFTGQLYRILLPQGALEIGTVTGPPEISVEIDEVSAEGLPLLDGLKLSRSDITTQLTGSQAIAFGNLAVEADRDIFVSAGYILDPTNNTIIPIGGPTGSTIENGALIKVSGGTATTINLPGVQAYSLGLDSDLAPAVPVQEKGQVDNGVLWVAGTNTGNVAVVDTAAGTNAQTLAIPDATSVGGVSVNPGTGFAFVAGQSLQNVTIFGAGSVPDTAPAIVSAVTGIFAVGSPNSLNVIATGSPTPTLSHTGTLPQGVTFKDNGNGTATLAGTPAAGTEGDYPLTFKASNGVLPDATKAFTLSVGTSPVITSAATITFTVGSAGSFTATATPNTGTLIATLSEVGALPTGVTFTDNEDGTATLAGTPAPGTEGTYPLTITATNGVPPDATQAFTLIVNGPGNTSPAITAHPANQTVTAGQTATFTSAASGNPTPAVQWQRSTDNGSTWSNIAGATSTSYTTASTTTAMNGHQYRAVFTNSAGSVTSNAATLTVNNPATAPTVTTHPANQTVTAGQTAAFTAAASGSPTPTVQWELSTDNGSTWSNIAGATGTSYTTASTTTTMNGHRYRAVFTNSAGSATSNSAILTVNPAGLPVATLSPTSLSFSSQVINTASTAKTVTLSNSGTGPLTISSIVPSGSFAVVSQTCGTTLAAAAKCTVQVNFTPTQLGTLKGALTFTHNAANSPLAVTLTGTAVLPAALTPTSASYGYQALGTTSAAKNFTLVNNQSSSLNSIATSISGNFAISATTCATSLAAKGKCTISVTFTPTTTGTKMGMLTVTHSASNSPQTVSLTGMGVLPVTLSPISASYGYQALGTTSAAKAFTLTNNQGSSLNSIALSISGDFAISATTCASSLAAKNKCTISVTFAPAATGAKTGTLTVTHSASNSPQNVSLMGTGVLPATLTPTSLSYGYQTVGTTSVAKMLTLTNNLSVSLNSIVISPSGDFAVSATTCTSSLAAKGKCTISVTFTPTATGVRTGTLMVTHSAGNSPQNVSLKGTGR